jgi:hypothetical protein
MDHMKTALAIAAWLGALCSPSLVAIFFWKLSRRVRSAWLIHLAVLPCALAFEWLFARLLFRASGDSGDGPPGLGLALVPCAVSTLLAVGIYFGCLGVMIWQKRRQAA